MVQKKFRGVRQRHWGSWVSEIRHPLLKRRVWLGTFESAEEAARAYDEASVLMNGRNAKTNFPVIPRTVAGEAMPGKSSPPTGLSVLLREKLRRCCKVQSPSLTCLRLDPEKYSYIRVWQKGAGAQSESNWVMRVELGKKTAQVMSSTDSSSAALPAETGSSTSAAAGAGGGLKEEEKIALQMIEELLNSPSPP